MNAASSKRATASHSARSAARGSRQRGGGQGPQRALLIIVGVAVVAVAVLIGVLSSREAASRVTAEDIAGDVTVEGQSLEQFGGDPGADPFIGTPAPVVTGADFDGRPAVIGGTGNPQIVSFMASWCPACQQELPVLVDWLEQGRLPDGVELMVVSTGLDHRRPNWPPMDWLDEEGYTGPLIVDDVRGSIAAAFGLSATPFWVVIDAQGDVVVRVAGMLSQTQFDQLAALATGR